MYWVIFWVALSLSVNTCVYFAYGSEAALQFFTGYIIEQSLSVDNLFVFSMIFALFGTPKDKRPKILYWGVLGAIVMRLAFILLGISLISRFHWMIYLLGAFLIISGIRLLKEKEHVPPIVSYLKKFLPVIVVIELTDIVFALDSIPAILAITTDPFIAIGSNVCAILGLRSLYFVLEAGMDKFVHLKKGISAILVFTGCKMVLSPFYAIPLPLVLGVIFLILLISITFSLKK